MKKIRMTITITDKYEVSTNFRGTSEELAECNRALARHIKKQNKVSFVLANAANFSEERPTVANPEYVQRKQLEQNPKAGTK